MATRRIMLTALAAWFVNLAPGQSLFQMLGQGLSAQGSRVFLEDTITDILYVGGSSFHAGVDVTSPGIFSWDGSQFQAMGCGFNWNCVSQLSNGGMANPVVTLAFWGGELYAGGGITSASGVPINYIARWDGSAWQPLADGVDNHVTRLRGYPDGLYAVGSFTHAGGVEANGLARWDGSSWHAVFDLPLFGTQSVNLLNDVAFYQGQCYIGGNFGGGNGLYDIAYYNGTEWTAIGNGLLGVFSTVNSLMEHQGLLYVAGEFSGYAPNGNPDNPGSGIVTWNGSEYQQLGSGTRGAGNPNIRELTWIRDTLFVSGPFNRIGDVPSGGLAKWDGDQWCSLVPPNYFNGGAGPIGSYRDTLIFGGGPTMAGPDTINGIAKWVGGAYVDSCGLSVGLREHTNSISFVIAPNPASTSITLHGLPPTATALLVHDILGRTVMRANARSTWLDVESLPNGTYSVKVLDAWGSSLGTARFIKD